MKDRLWLLYLSDESDGAFRALDLNSKIHQ